MLDAFASVGANSFDVTGTTRAGEKEWFRRAMGYADLKRALPAMLDAALQKERNIIVRPHGSGVTFLQLDDLPPAMLPRLAPAVFLTLQTSRGHRRICSKSYAKRHRGTSSADCGGAGSRFGAIPLAKRSRH